MPQYLAGLRNDGGAGADLIDGGIGFDILVFWSATAGVALSLVTGGTAATPRVMYASVENIIGTVFNDFLEGNDLPNTILGGGGDNVIRGLGGDDWLGGGGSDTFYPGEGNNRVFVSAKLEPMMTSMSCRISPPGPTTTRESS